VEHRVEAYNSEHVGVGDLQEVCHSAHVLQRDPAVLALDHPEGGEQGSLSFGILRGDALELLEFLRREELLYHRSSSGYRTGAKILHAAAHSRSCPRRIRKG
jgi:hypothetical protein